MEKLHDTSEKIAFVLAILLITGKLFNSNLLLQIGFIGSIIAYGINFLTMPKPIITGRRWRGLL